jgi:carbon monoxide dehydrogenase subunit G
MKVEVTVDIAAPPQVVHGVMTDIARWPEIITGIGSVEILDPGPIRVGTRFRETRTMFGREATEEMTVTAIDPRQMVLTAENHGTRSVASHTIAPAAGGSRLNLTFEGAPVSFAARLLGMIGLLFRGALHRQLAADLADLKGEAERRARH